MGPSRSVPQRHQPDFPHPSEGSLYLGYSDVGDTREGPSRAEASMCLPLVSLPHSWVAGASAGGDVSRPFDDASG